MILRFGRPLEVDYLRVELRDVLAPELAGAVEGRAHAVRRLSGLSSKGSHSIVVVSRMLHELHVRYLVSIVRRSRIESASLVAANSAVLSKMHQFATPLFSSAASRSASASSATGA